MLRIRTIKPDFFTSDDVASLSPLARLFYIGLWCAADREGRLEWRLGQLKRQFLPDDQVNIQDVADELLKRELVVLYEDGELAVIPTFLKHQVIDREAQSKLPAPPSSVKVFVPSRNSAKLDDGREGKGRERKGKEEGEKSPPQRGCRLPDDWSPGDVGIEYAQNCGIGRAGGKTIAQVAEAFVDHWRAATGQKAVKRDWAAAWRTWCRNEIAFAAQRGGGAPAPGARPRFN